MTRRGFLAAGAAVVAAGGAVAVLRHHDRFPARSLLAIVDDPALMANLGRVAASEVGSDPERAAKAIAPPGHGASWVDRASPQEVRAHLEAAIKADFAAGRTVRVGGWLLGITGARAALIVAHAAG